MMGRGRRPSGNDDAGQGGAARIDGEQRDRAEGGAARNDKAALPRPVAGRMRRPSWRDSRLAIGLLLMLVAVGGGAATIKHFDDSVQVLRATRTLVPGDRLSPGDVERVKVRIDAGRSAYLAAVQSGGRVLREVRAGELVPSSAISTESNAAMRTVAVNVDPAQAATLVKGSVVDLWVAIKTPGSTSPTDFEEPHKHAERVLVARTPSAGGGFNVTSDDYVYVLVPDDKVAQLLSAMNRGAKVSLVPTAGSPLRGSAS